MGMRALPGQLRARKGHQCLLQVGGRSGLGSPVRTLTFGTPGKVFRVSAQQNPV